jgi:hypothetical protein
MYEPILHQHSGYANKTVPWFSSDNQDTYIKNMSIAKQKEIIDRNQWTEHNITYSFNSHGFRSDEFTEDDSVMFLGCSLTLGTGISKEDSWTHLVSQSLNLKNYNLGISGGSNDSAFRLANHYIPQLKPKIVVLMITCKQRFDIITPDEIYTIMHTRVPKQFDGEFYKSWITYAENSKLNRKKNCLAIEYLCREHGIKFVSNVPTDQLTWPLEDNGRDIIHPGRGLNRKLASAVLSLI